jgi:hypothetical protein
MKKLSLEQMEVVEGGKFWGSTYVWSDPDGDGSGTCTRYYTVLGIITWETNDIANFSGGSSYCNSYWMN